MEGHRFDRIVRTLAPRQSRRALLVSIGGLMATLRASEVAESRRRTCQIIGARCRKSRDCCSGICQGQRRAGICRGHDTGGCRAGNRACRTPPESCTTSLGAQGGCLTTTGDGGYCAATGECMACSRDTDCQKRFGQRAACVTCSNCSAGTACASP